MSFFRPKFSLRFSLVFVTMLVMLVAWLGSRWRQHVRCEKAYQTLVASEVAMQTLQFPSKLFVDAANELRKLSHADAVTVVRRFEQQERFKSGLAMRVVYPLAFEPNADCPDEWLSYFDIEKSYPGFLYLREEIPFLFFNLSFFENEHRKGEVLDRWGKVRSGLLPTKSSDWYEWQRKLIRYLPHEPDARDERLKTFVDDMDRLGFDAANDDKIAALRTYFDRDKAAGYRMRRSHVVRMAKDLDIDLSNEDLDEWGVDDLHLRK